MKQTRRYISCLLALVMCISLLPVSTFAATEPPEKKLYSEIDLSTIPEYGTDHFSGLSLIEKAELLLKYDLTSFVMMELEAEEIPLTDSINYALVMKTYSLPANEVIHASTMFGDVNLLAQELYRFEQFQRDKDLAQEMIDSVHTMILNGYEYVNAVQSYASAQVLGVDVEDVLIEAQIPDSRTEEQDQAFSATTVPEWDATQAHAELFPEEPEMLEAEYGIQSDVIESFLSVNTMEVDDFKVMVQEEIKSYLGTVPTMAGTPSAASAATPTYVQPEDERIFAPSSFKVTDYEKINLSNGNYTYEETDLRLPGKNGLDLTMMRRYDMSDANIENAVPEILNGNLQVYTLKYAFYLSDPADPWQCVESRRISPSDYNLYTWGDHIIDDRDFNEPYTLNERDYLLSDLSLWGYMSYLTRKTTGQTIIILARPEITVNEANMRAAVELLTLPNFYSIDRYNLGYGWGYAFTGLTDYPELINGRQIPRKETLWLADGRKFTIDYWQGGSMVSAKIDGYDQKDFILYKGSNLGYPGAAYVVKYADGKREFLDNKGYLIAIQDKYENTITFSYEMAGNTVTKMTIIDTVGREVVFKDEANNPNQKTLTVDGALVRTFTKQTYNQYIRLRTMEDENGNITSYSNGNSPLKTHPLCPYPTVLDVSLSNEYLGAITPPYVGAENRMYLSFSTATQRRYIHGGIGYQEFAYLNQRNIHNGTNERWYSTDRVGYGIGNPTVYGSTECGRFSSTYNHTYNVSETTSFSLQHGGYPSIIIEVAHTAHVFNKNSQKTGETHREYFEESLVQPDNYLELVDDWITRRWANPQPLPTWERSYLYDQYDQISRMTERTHGANCGGNSIERITQYTHDAYGNTTRTVDPDGRITDFTFDTANYNMPLTKTYKRDANTTILERYTLTSDKKGIATSEVLENNALRGKTEYIYDTIGNITAERRYKDDFTSFIETVHSYQDNQNRPAYNGAYQTKTTTPGVENADGGFAQETPGYTPGTVVNEFYYDGWGRVWKAVDANGGLTEYKYDLKGNIQQETRPDGAFVTYDRDYPANILTVTDENGYALQYKYDSFGNPISLKDMVSGQFLNTCVYNNDHYLIEEVQYSSEDSWQKTLYTNDLQGRVLTKKCYDETDELLSSESYAYQDSYQGLYQKITKTIHGDSSAPDVVTTEYKDKMGNVVKQGAFLNGTEILDTFTYDYLGNKTSALSAKDAAENRAFTARWEYDYAGRVTKETNALGQSALKGYDALGRNTSATDLSGNVSTFSYDVLGRLLKQETPFENTGGTIYKAVKTYDYDPNGNVLREQTQNNAPGAAQSFAKTEYDYNNRGFLTNVNSYDGAAVASRVQYTYDAMGNMLTQATGSDGEAVTAYTYDRFGNMLTLTDALGQRESYTYDLAGNPLTKTDRNGAVTTYTYDGLGRPLNTAVRQNGAVTGQTTMTYTPTGQTRTLSNAQHTTTSTYDGLGRLIQESETGDVVKTYRYDLGGNRIGFRTRLGDETILNTTYTYDTLNRLKTVIEDGVTQATYTYDTSGNRASLTNAAGVATTYSYNLANMVTSLENKKGGVVQSSYTYTYNLDGNQKSKTDHEGRATAYAYDGLGRLTREAESGAADAKTVLYTYDGRNNRETLTVSGSESYSIEYQYDLNNRLLDTQKTVGGDIETTTYQYDPNGNTLSTVTETLSSAGSGAGTVALESPGSGYQLNAYDEFNQLVSTTIDGVVTTYTYKPNGLRLSKNDTTYVWDGQNTVAELNGDETKVYIRGIGLIAADDGTAVAYFSFNAHGDVVQMTDDTGVVTKNYRYDAFGVEQGIDPEDTNPWRYCGEYFDVETGTVYLRARYYDPVIGRFTQQDTHWNPRNAIYGDEPLKINEQPVEPNDPLGLTTYTFVPSVTAIMQSGNLYVYCMGNPVLLVDPDGHATKKGNPPPPSSGFKPKKGKAPGESWNKEKGGWEDKNGNIWVPDPFGHGINRETGSADHWDVQNPNGNGYVNVGKDGHKWGGKGPAPKIPGPLAPEITKKPMPETKKPTPKPTPEPKRKFPDIQLWL